MFLYKVPSILLIFASLLFNLFAHADEPRSWSASVSLLSWQEQVTLQNGSTTDYATASFYGAGIQLAKSSFYGESKMHGTWMELSLLSGSTTVGGTQPTLSYQNSNIPWWGSSLSYMYAYRLSDQLLLCVGPELFYRQISYAGIGGTSASSGTAINYGLTGEMRENVNDRLAIYQSIGTLLVKASTLWSFGLGYDF
jgi:hypothetical protein